MAAYAKAIAKALVGAGTALGTALATALADGTITPQEWVTAAVATLVALGVIYAVPNKPAP